MKIKKHTNSVLIVLFLALGGLFVGSAQADPDPKKLRYSMYSAAIGTTEEKSFDPLRTYQLQYFDLQHQVFETLVSFDTNTQQLIPVLAEKWDRIGETTIRFFLRRDVRFHNGEPFTSRSVKFTVELMQNPQNRFAGRFLLKTVKEVNIIDDYTVDFVLQYPDALLLRKIATMGFLFPPKYYRQVGDTYFSRYPMGTGPFRIFYGDETKSGKEFHLVANEDYWGTPTAIEELIYKSIPHDKQWPALQRGDIDLLITQQLPDDYTAKKNPDLNVFSRKAIRSSFCITNIDKQGPLQDIRVRRAVQHALDRNAIIANALGGYGTPLYTTIPDGTVGKPAEKAVYAENPSLARKLLKQAGRAEGFTLKLMASKNRPSIDVANSLQKQLTAIGITLDITYVTRDEIIREIVDPKLKGRQPPSSYDLWLVNGWPILFRTCTHFYFVFLNSHGMFNFGLYAGKESPIDALYQQTITSGNSETFHKNLNMLDSFIMENALVLPIYQPDIIYAMHKKVDFDPGLNDLPHRFSQCSIKE